MSWPAHRTPRYVWDRFREWMWQRQNPNAPWLGPRAVSTLETLLQSHMQGLEFGAGRSTGWVASRVARLESWEESPAWREKVAEEITTTGVLNVTLYLVEKGDQDWESAYAKVIATLANRSFDFVLVDTDHAREQLCRQFAKQLKPGGFLMLDNANWYLPSASHSPHSRSYNQGAATTGWQEFLDAVADWECIWTTSGVTDTAFFLRGEGI